MLLTKLTNRIKHACFVFLESTQSGLSIIEVLIAAGLLGFLVVAFMQNFGDQTRNTRDLKDKVDLAAVGNYILQFADCVTTQADPGFAGACASGSPINIRDRRNQVIVSNDGTKFADYLTVTNSCTGGQIKLFAKTDLQSVARPIISGIPISCPVAPPADCRSFKISWSNTKHGECDYSISGSASKIIISDGKISHERNSLSGSIPCTPWNGNFGDLKFTPSVFNSGGQSETCPAKKLACNRQVFQIVRGAAVIDGIQQLNKATITFDDRGVTHKEKNALYRHWLFVSGVTNASSGSRSVAIGGNIESGSFPRFGGIHLSVGNTEVVSRYGRADASGLNSKKETPLLNGDVEVKYTGNSNSIDGRGPGLGIFVANCTNGPRAPYPTAIKGDGSTMIYGDAYIKGVISSIKTGP